MNVCLDVILPAPLRKYERIIDYAINDMGIRGKLDEFRREGKLVLMAAKDLLFSNLSEKAIEFAFDTKIREHFRRLLGHR
ncbi:hypothetical protein EQV77_08880 [Halobacillus fulvus]|nr:hypothetical protein EQV77_08880 [Halobacillus fulvus]